MQKKHTLTFTVCLVASLGFAQVHQPVTNQSNLENTRVKLKTRKTPKEEWKSGYVIDMKNDSIGCSVKPSGATYLLKSRDGHVVGTADNIKKLYYMDIVKGRFIFLSLPVPFDRSDGKRYFFQVIQEGGSFSFLKNENNTVDRTICAPGSKYLKNYYFLDRVRDRLIPAHKSNLLMLAGEFREQVEAYLRSNKNQLKNEDDYVSALLHLQSLRRAAASKGSQG